MARQTIRPGQKRRTRFPWHSHLKTRSVHFSPILDLVTRSMRLLSISGPFVVDALQVDVTVVQCKLACNQLQRAACIIELHNLFLCSQLGSVRAQKVPQEWRVVTGQTERRLENKEKTKLATYKIKVALGGIRPGKPLDIPNTIISIESFVGDKRKAIWESTKNSWESDYLSPYA